MFNPITIPFGCVMLNNVVKLKPGVTTEDVEMAIGEMCNVVKNTYGNERRWFSWWPGFRICRLRFRRGFL